MNLTDPQKNGLRYFLAVETQTNLVKVTRSTSRSRYHHPDPRVIARLNDLALIKVAGYHYGPLWVLTEAGRALANTLKED